MDSKPDKEPDMIEQKRADEADRELSRVSGHESKDKNTALKMLNAMGVVSASNVGPATRSQITLARVPRIAPKLSEAEQQERNARRKANKKRKQNKRAAAANARAVIVERRKKKRNAQKEKEGRT